MARGKYGLLSQSLLANEGQWKQSPSARPRQRWRNLHGIITVGETASAAFSLMNECGRVSRMQLRIEAGGADLPEIPGDACERVATQRETHDREFRDLDTIDPVYRC